MRLATEQSDTTETKVGELEVTLCVDEEVVGLEVAVGEEQISALHGGQEERVPYRWTIPDA